MSQYLTAAEFTTRTILPDQWIAEVLASYPSFLDGQLTSYSSLIDSRLAKRYQVPFTTAPYPEQIKIWLTNLVQPLVLLKRGVDPADAQVSVLFQLQKDTFESLKEAADSKDGLYELPLRADVEASQGVSRGYIMSRSDQSPYTWTDRQRRARSDGYE